MDKFSIEIINDGAIQQFDVVDYAHDDDNRCKFEILKESKLLASFEPDSCGFLHLCKNPGNLNEPILHLIADKLESYNF